MRAGGSAPPVTAVSFVLVHSLPFPHFTARKTCVFHGSLIPDPQDRKFLCVVISATQRGGDPAAESSNWTPAEVLTGSCPSMPG